MPRKTSAKIQPPTAQRTVLIATTGLSPAILTETVWALAREKPAVIPDEIIVLTTQPGKMKIAEQLFGPDEVWRQLRHTLLGKYADNDPRLDFDTTPDRVHVVHHRVGTRRVPLDELATPEQNTAFADAIVDELWKYTSKPDTRVVASLAGGFKTMSALMLSAMQLLANPGDRVTHVLVSGGFDTATPPFFFPEQHTQDLKARDGSALRAAHAAPLIQLIDLPLIPLRRWFEDALHRKPPSYATLVHGSLSAIEAAVGDISLELGPIVLPEGRKKHWMRLNGQEHPLSPDRYAYLRFFAEKLKGSAPVTERPADIVDEIEEWLLRHKNKEPRFHRMLETYSSSNPRRIAADSLPKRLNDLRTHLKKLPGGPALAAALPGKGHWGIRLDKNRINLL